MTVESVHAIDTETGLFRCIVTLTAAECAAGTPDPLEPIRRAIGERSQDMPAGEHGL